MKRAFAFVAFLGALYIAALIAVGNIATELGWRFG